jgi:disulfide bond formation protein DsbB
MIEKIRDMARDEPIASAALAVALGGTATILGAWFFQYALKYQPCPLCLEQRIPYYIAIPLGVLVAAAALRRLPRKFLVAGLGLIVLVMLWGAGLGVYHAGVEWKLWAGPLECSGQLNDLGTAGDLLRRVQTARIVRCDEAAWRFLGISLAGYNVLIALALAAIAASGVVCARRYGSNSVSQ